MEYLNVTAFFLTVIFSSSIGQINGNRRYKYITTRSLQHPPFSMGTPMAFPGNTMQNGYISGAQPECITEDIVCPAWCLMEDEWGCKYCPCGPANGMSPPVVSNYKPEIEHEESHGCIGTILCMLSCKEGYKLGHKDSAGGCQSCTCVKRNETNAKEGETRINRTNTFNSSHSTDSGSCTWPLCMNGQGPNNGPGSGAQMTSLPIGGVKGGGSLPGVDCLGPSCSAKNGIRMMGNAIPPTKTPVPLRPPSTPFSPFQPTTKHPQPVIHLVPPTRNTLLLVAPTRSPHSLYLVPVPTEAPARHCTTLHYCMNSCKYGFQVENSRQECPHCDCIQPLTPPPSVITTKPDFIAIMRVCPDAVHCMKSCTNGYTLTSSHTETCPICTCNIETKVLLLCERPLSCPYGCTVGYKGDEEGCPTCKCVEPSETRLRIEVKTTTIDSALTCNPRFSCVDKCSLGYKTGYNSCPTCVCLEPVTAQQPHPLSQMTSPEIVQSSGLGCIGPACSAIHAVPQRLVLQCEQPLTCSYGCTVGFKTDMEGCPKCSCIAPSETTHKNEVHNVVVEKELECEEQFVCQEQCAFGIKTGRDGCPSCTCLQPVKGYLQGTIPMTRTPSPIIVKPSGLGCVGPACSAIHAVPQPLTLKCEQPLSCTYGCTVGFKIDKEGCPKCSCIAPSETTNNVNVQAIVVQRILKCKDDFACPERCTFGFKSGPDGCPSCVCLQPGTGKNGNIFLSTVGNNTEHTNILPGNIVSPTEPTLISSGIDKPAGIVITQNTSIKKPHQNTGNRPNFVVEKPSNNIEGSRIIPDTSKDLTAMEACPETVACIMECKGTYNLTQRDGETCPDCKCIHQATGCIGPSCAAPGSHNPVEQIITPSPGECVAILHCVLTCNSGYDIGDYSRDGCPTCTCVK